MRLIHYLWMPAILTSVQAFTPSSRIVISSIRQERSYGVIRVASHPTKYDFPAVSNRRGFFQLTITSSSLLLPQVANAASKGLGEEYRQGTAALAEMDTDAPVPREAYKKLSSGTIYADLRSGNGNVVKEGSRVNLQWVLRKSNGYFVDSSERNDSVPFIFTVGDGNAIKGVDEGIQGMKEGGVRRLLIPPSLAYVEGLEDGKPGPLPNG